MKSKFIIITLSLLLCLALFSCAGEEAASSLDETGEVSDVTSEEETVSLGEEEALALIERDEEAINIFVNCSLAAKNGVAPVDVAPASEYSSFSAVEALLDSTYVSSSETRRLFLEWPGVGPLSVSDNGGNTRVFYHPGSHFDDFIVKKSVKVSDSGDGLTAVISARTYSGARISLDCVYENGAWLLCEGLFAAVGPEPDVAPAFAFSRMGSLAEFRGRLLCVELYVYDDEKVFDSGTENRVSDEVGEALGFLKTQAESYGASVELVREKLYYRHKGVIGERSYDIDMMFAQSSLKSLTGLLEAQYELGEYDGCVVFLCRANDAETSEFRYENNDETAVYFSERVNVSLQSTAGEIALSLMKLLGAEDFGRDDTEAYLSMLFGTYFPDEIMLGSPLDEASVSAVNAYICGMTDKMPALLSVFAPEAED